LGRAPLWPLLGINGVFVLLHLKLLRHVRRWKANWQDFEVTVESNRVLVRRHGSLESSASRSEIKRIFEVRGNCLWIQPAGRGFSLPSVLSGYEHLRRTLATWTTIEYKRSLPLWDVYRVARCRRNVYICAARPFSLRLLPYVGIYRILSVTARTIFDQTVEDRRLEVAADN
jgi:hypothetical protein